jgi:poly-gamma-glutamate synthesis protein (capsule biosynthesis protein)
LQADFWQSAIAGAVVVSGSQAHFPQGFDFVNGSFIDYGVGNLFFDQMQTWYRKATIDTHYFYNGSYINTALRPIINENQGQPRLMTIEESERFLSKLYENSFYEKK